MNNLTKYLSVFFSILILASCGETAPKEEKSEEPKKEVEVEEVVELKVKGEEVDYSSAETEMKGYVAYDENKTGDRPGILVVHEWWGHTDYVRERADMLAELGYVALAVDMYGDGQTAEHPDDAQKFSGMVMKNMDDSKAKFQAAYDMLKNHPEVADENISAIGYCFGGSVILAMANAGMDLDGVAAFHSGVQVPVPPGEDLKAKVLIQNGGDDPFISDESVQTFKTRMDEIDKPYEYIEYPGVLHGYTNPGATENGEKFDLPLAYDAEADEKSWNKLQEFLNGLYGEQ
ncbi:MAG: dienelactone hydrolase family protein [Flavobacteriales bacterium]|nr:dienelactone hydrolase family protein [Flavobacteriales bacterium]